MLERDMRLVAPDRRALPRRDDLLRRFASTSCAAPRRTALPVTCGVSINNLALNENDIGDYRTFLQARRRRCATRTTGRPSSRRSPTGVIDVDRVRPQSAGRGDEAPALRRSRRRRASASRPCCRRRCASSMRARSRLPKLLRALSTRPAEILGLPGGRLTPGAPADLILFDPDAPYVLDKRELALALQEHALRRGAPARAGAADHRRRPRSCMAALSSAGRSRRQGRRSGSPTSSGSLSRRDSARPDWTTMPNP